MLVICSTIENEAIWATESLVSIGLIGSWCCSWATNSFRKPSLLSAAFGLARGVWELAAGAPLVGDDCHKKSPIGGSGEDVDEHAVGEDDGGFGEHGRRVGLTGTVAGG